jgi:hypothetical protein
MDIDRIMSTARKDARCVGSVEIRALCDEIERLRRRVDVLEWRPSPDSLCGSEREEVMSLLEKYNAVRGSALHDGTIPDMVNDEFVFEVDTPKRWAEAIGQALHYGDITGLKPAVLLYADFFSDWIHSVSRCAYTCGRHGVALFLESNPEPNRS